MIQRRVIGRKDQKLVALPAEVRRHLGITTPGTAVWWHITRDGEVRLTAKPRAPRGPERTADCTNCAAMRREVEKLRGRIAARPAAIVREGQAQGWAQVAGVEARIGAEVGALRERVSRLLDIVEPRAKVLRRRPTKRTPVEPTPAPVQTPPLEVSDGGAVASGA